MLRTHRVEGSAGGKKEEGVQARPFDPESLSHLIKRGGFFGEEVMENGP